MLNRTFHIITWDADQQPDWTDVQLALSCYTTPVITPIATAGDQYAILISSVAVTPSQAREAYARWAAQRRPVMGDWRQRCLEAYAEHCYVALEVPSDAQADAWLHEWAALEAEFPDPRESFRDGV